MPQLFGQIQYLRRRAKGSLFQILSFSPVWLLSLRNGGEATKRLQSWWLDVSGFGSQIRSGPSSHKVITWGVAWTASEQFLITWDTAIPIWWDTREKHFLIFWGRNSHTNSEQETEKAIAIRNLRNFKNLKSGWVCHISSADYHCDVGTECAKL